MNEALRRSLQIFSLALALSLASAAPAAQPDSYDGCLEGAVNGLISPLIDVLTSTKKAHIQVGVAQFKELVTGQRSDLSPKLEKDLATKMRNAMVFKIPSAYYNKKALDSLDGYATDISAPETLKKFAKVLDVDAVVTGEYFVQGSRIILRVHMLPVEGLSASWDDSRSFPAADINPELLALAPGTAPSGYKATDIPVDASQTVESASGASATAQSLSDTTSAITLSATASLDKIRVYNDNEDEFSWTRVSGGLGYERLYPQNPTFAKVTGALNGFYFNLGWADVFDAQFDFWSAPSVALSDVSSLLAFGFSVSASLPYRIGNHTIVYAGLGGRMESIGVNDSNLPSSFPVSFANNSLFVQLGAKVHKGPYGFDLNLSNDVLANETTYFKIKTGFYYEYSFN